jgi:hypothetical protein
MLSCIATFFVPIDDCESWLRTQTLSQNPIFRAEEHVSQNLTDALWLSADAYYNVGGETRIDGVAQGNMANTLKIGAGLGLRMSRGGDFILNYERVVAKPSGEPEAHQATLVVSSAGDQISYSEWSQ